MGDPIRVLHVDDEPRFGELAAEFLERADDRFDVYSERSVDDGLRQLRTEPDRIDCIVSDYDMPRRNGIDFLEAVRAEFPEIPFVLFTGKGSEEVAGEAISAGATDYLQKESGTEQYEILANRVANAVEQFRSTRRAENLERLRNLSAEVNHELVRAETREAVEQTVCETISSTEPYRFAWIGSVDADSARVVPRAKAGEENGYLEAVSVPSGDDDATKGPAAVAIQERRIVVSQDIENDPAFEPWREEALARDFRAVAAAPLVYDSTLYGVLVVYATRANVFDEDEQELLEVLADDIAHAIHAREVRSDLEEFRALLDNANDAIYMMDPETGDFLEVNAQAQRRLGYDRDELLSRSFVDVDQELKDVEAYRELVAQLRSDGSVLVEGVHETADGSTFPVEVRGNYVTVNDRGYVVAIARDITEKRRRQEQIQRQRNALFELITDDTVTEGDFESAVERITESAADVLDVRRVNVWLFEADASTLRCVDDYDETTGRHDRGSTLHTDTFPVYFKALRNNRTIEANAARRDPRTRELTNEYLRPNNVESLLDATLRSEGEVAGVLCVENVGSTREWTEDEIEFVSDLADIVDRARRNRETRERKRELELHEQVIDEAPVGVTITDNRRPDNPVVYANGEFSAITGYDADAVEGRNHRFLQGPETSEAPVETMRAAVDAGEPTSVELRNYRQDGDSFWNRVSIAPIRDEDGEITNWVGFQEDVTDRKQREESLLRQSERFDELANVISHDLQTPLSTAEARAELAIDTGDVEQMEKALAAIRRTNKLRTDLIDVLRKREVVSETDDVDVEAAVDTVWGSITAAEDASVTVDDAPVVDGDTEAVNRLLENLLSNAVEHGGEDVTVRVGEMDEGFYVADDGPGIDPENRDAVFTLGFSTKEDGSGVGMASVREIVLAHDWTISIAESEAGGARFEIRTE